MSISSILNSEFLLSSKLSIVPIILIKVVFPAPEGPTIDTKSPLEMFREIFSNIF